MMFLQCIFCFWNNYFLIVSERLSIKNVNIVWIEKLYRVVREGYKINTVSTNTKKSIYKKSSGFKISKNIIFVRNYIKTRVRKYRIKNKPRI